MYHGTTTTDNLDKDKSFGMIWLTENVEYARTFGDIINVIELNETQKIFDASEMTEETTLSDWIEWLEENNIDTTDIDLDKADFAPDYGYYTFYDLLPHAGNNYQDCGVLAAIKKSGFDMIESAPEENWGIDSGRVVVLI